MFVRDPDFISVREGPYTSVWQRARCGSRCYRRNRRLERVGLRRCARTRRRGQIVGLDVRVLNRRRRDFRRLVYRPWRRRRDRQSQSPNARRRNGASDETATSSAQIASVRQSRTNSHSRTTLANSSTWARPNTDSRGATTSVVHRAVAEMTTVHLRIAAPLIVIVVRSIAFTHSTASSGSDQSSASAA
jgi:hypothetical protein